VRAGLFLVSSCSDIFVKFFHNSNSISKLQKTPNLLNKTKVKDQKGTAGFNLCNVSNRIGL
jgi:hypothetical protein